MSTEQLRNAAQAICDHWGSPAWKYLEQTGSHIRRLRAALDFDAVQVTEAESPGRVLFEATDQTGRGWEEAWREHGEWEQRAKEASAEPQKYDDTLLPFVGLMRRELHANSAKGDRPGWLAMTPPVCLLEIYWHVSKLSVAVRDGDPARIAEHCADVANMAMMQADIAGLLTPRTEAAS